MTKLATRAHEAIEAGEPLKSTTGAYIVICTRCGGGGSYSFNLMDGTMCYGCKGQGVKSQKAKPKTAAQREAAREKAWAKKQAAEEARIRTAMYDLIPAFETDARWLQSNRDGDCAYCGSDIASGDPIRWSPTTRQVFEVGCYADRMLDLFDDNYDAIRDRLTETRSAAA